jgi:cation diffusion facilitator family transporter
MMKKNHSIKISPAEVTKKVTFIGAGVNIILAASKTAVGLKSGSNALVADGIHSLSDLISDAAVIFGAGFIDKEFDEKHPYGHNKVETLISLCIALLLTGAACSILTASVKSIQNPQNKHINGLLVFITASVSIIVKELLFRWTNKAALKINSKSLRANAWHHRSDALSSVPVAAAVIFTFIHPSFYYFDTIAAVIVCAMLFHAAWKIGIPCINELLDSRGDKGLSGYLDIIKKNEKGIIEFHKIRSRSSGNAIFVDMHMLVDENMSVGKSHALTKKVEKLLKDYNKDIIDITIHVEPAKELNNVADQRSKTD